MRKLIPAIAATLLLAGCADHYSDSHYRPYAMTRNGGEIDYEILDRVLFANDSADIGPRAYDAIADIADDIRQHRRAEVEVDGYTDTTGTHEHNMELSRMRADAVAGILVRHGVERGRIRTQGFGETHQAVRTGNDVREARNRRVIIRIFAPS